MFHIFILLCKIVLVVLVLLLSIAYFTLVERKVMGTIQRRKGPNVVGFLGLLQPLADGLKLFIKEMIFVAPSVKFLFVFSPFLLFLLGLFIWSVIPFGNGLVISNLNLGVLFMLSISSLNVYSIMLAGWSSNSKYALLGSLRTIAQMISYEISFGFIIMVPIILCQSLNFIEIVNFQRDVWFVIPLFPIFIAFFVSVLAETNRHPFDLPEAESELVSGYNVEYSGMLFALFFLAEYGNMIFMSVIIVLFFFGGWLVPFFTPTSILGLFISSFLFGWKVCIFLFFIAWARVALPRYRYDHLMEIGWKVLCPLSISWVCLFVWYVVCFNII